MKQPTEMERRVADTMYVYTENNPPDLIKLARAVIRSMREPTESSLRAGARKLPAGHGQAWVGLVGAWRSMIDDASPPQRKNRSTRKARK